MKVVPNSTTHIFFFRPMFNWVTVCKIIQIFQKQHLKGISFRVLFFIFPLRYQLDFVLVCHGCDVYKSLGKLFIMWNTYGYLVYFDTGMSHSPNSSVSPSLSHLIFNAACKDLLLATAADSQLRMVLETCSEYSNLQWNSAPTEKKKCSCWVWCQQAIIDRHVWCNEWARAVNWSQRNSILLSLIASFLAALIF